MATTGFTKNFVVKNGLTTGNINLYAGNSNISASFVVADLSVPSSANLGIVGNIYIGGGTNGQVLSTNGSGSLSWVAQTGGGGGAVGVAVGAVDVFTANGTGNTFTLTTTPTNENQLTVNIDGVLQLHSSYSLAGNVVTLDGTPVNGAIVEITNYSSGGASGSNTQVQFNDSGNIAGNSNMTFDKATSTFNATNITVNGAPVATTGKAIAMAIVFGF